MPLIKHYHSWNSDSIIQRIAAWYLNLVPAVITLKSVIQINTANKASAQFSVTRSQNKMEGESSGCVKPKRIFKLSKMDCLQCQSVIALGLLLTSVFVSIVIILILPDFDRIDGQTEVCVQFGDSIKCGRTEDTLHQYLDSVRVA